MYKAQRLDGKGEVEGYYRKTYSGNHQIMPRPTAIDEHIWYNIDPSTLVNLELAEIEAKWDKTIERLTKEMLDHTGAKAQIEAAKPKLELYDEMVKALGGLSPEVLAFAKTMPFKLDKNKHKACSTMNPDGKGRGWKHCHFTWLHERLIEEAEELYKALKNRVKDPDAVRKECADVGNFAMMIHDNTATKAIEKKVGKKK